MKPIKIQELVEKAKQLQAECKKWHFHMLTPDCVFNERKDKQAFVLENESDSEVFIVYSNERYMKEGKELVRLIHGNSIINEDLKPKITDKNVELMIEKAKKLNENGTSWHHHILFPNCMFNKHKGKWCIVFEDKEQNKILEAVSDDEPKDNLRAIEILYYKQNQ